MEILCPNCQKRLTIGDEHAGKIMRCPMCMGMFTAPALPPTTMPPAPPSPVPSPPAPPPMLELPGSPSASPADTAAPHVAAAAPEETPSPPPPPGDYRRSFSFRLRPDVLAWIAPVSVGILFLLSIFPWVTGVLVIRDPAIDIQGLNLWLLAFGRAGSIDFVFYVLMTLILGLPIVVASLLIAIKVIPLPPGIQPFLMWRPLIVTALLLVGFLILALHYLLNTFGSPGSTPWMTPWMRLAFFIHLVAVIASALESWVTLRKPKNLPPPKVEMRW